MVALGRGRAPAASALACADVRRRRASRPTRFSERARRRAVPARLQQVLVDELYEAIVRRAARSRSPRALALVRRARHRRHRRTAPRRVTRGVARLDGALRPLRRRRRRQRRRRRHLARRRPAAPSSRPAASTPTSTSIVVGVLGGRAALLVAGVRREASSRTPMDHVLTWMIFLPLLGAAVDPLPAGAQRTALIQLDGASRLTRAAARCSAVWLFAALRPQRRRASSSSSACRGSRRSTSSTSSASTASASRWCC